MDTPPSQWPPEIGAGIAGPVFLPGIWARWFAKRLGNSETGWRTSARPMFIPTMSFINRKNCIAVLLVLVVSHLALSAHVATHGADIQSSCEMCTGHGDPIHAAPPSLTSFDPVPNFLERLTPAQSQEPTTPVFDHRQRGPPLRT